LLDLQEVQVQLVLKAIPARPGLQELRAFKVRPAPLDRKVTLGLLVQLEARVFKEIPDLLGLLELKVSRAIQAQLVLQVPKAFKVMSAPLVLPERKAT
jgi:hypothetical protein